MDVSRMPKEGDKFGNWIIERTLDKGGMGMVYLAYNPDLGKSEKVALKVLDPAVAEKDADFVKRFYQEASIVFKTHCPNLVAIHDAGRDASSGFYYIVMEYLGGGTLRNRMRNSGPMPWREALSIIRPVALALAAVAKRKSVHRDIKPENIMFTSDGEVKLADFGIAKAAQDQTDDTIDPVKTRYMQIFGTPAYMSPEQMTDASAVDARADIWSLGVVLFEMLAGARPYPAKDIKEAGAFLLSSDPFPDIRSFKASSAEESVLKPTAVTLKTLPTMVTQTVCGDSNSCCPCETVAVSGKCVPPVVPDGVAALLSRMCDKDLGKRLASSEEVVAAIDELLGQTEERPTPEPGVRRYSLLAVACAALALFSVALCAVVICNKPSTSTAEVPIGSEPVVTNAPSGLPDVPEPVVTNAPSGLPDVPEPVVTNAPLPEASSLFQPTDGSIDEVLSQLEVVIGKAPKHLRVSLSHYARKKNMSSEWFETKVLIPVVERLHNSGLSFSLVPGFGKYSAVIEDVAKRRSVDLR